MGLKEFLNDSDENNVANPCHLKKAERRLKTLQRRLSRKKEICKTQERQKSSDKDVYAGATTA